MKILSLLLATVLPALHTAPAADQWPQFRGPHGNGHADATGLPLKWSAAENVKWSVPIAGKAWSSPVIWDDQVWVSTATPDGQQLSAVCVSKADGKVIHDLKLFSVANPQFCHKFNSYASPTPAIEAGRIYVTFGSPGTACLDTQTGKTLWERRDLECNHFRGAGSSPVIFENLLLLHFDGSDLQYVVALDKKTGKTVWKTNRSIDHKDIQPDGKIQADGDMRKAFATPHVETIDGQPLMLSQGAKAHYAYDPRTGKELWRVEERGQHSASTRPVYGNGMFYLPTGFSKGQLLAVRAGGSGVVTGTHVAWRLNRGVPNKPSLLLHNDLLFMIDDGGVAACVDAKTGADIWRERVGGNYSAAPILADGRLYFLSEEGKATVIEAGRQFKVLAENYLGKDKDTDGFMASPAVSGNALYLRTRTKLYRIEN